MSFTSLSKAVVVACAMAGSASAFAVQVQYVGGSTATPPTSNGFVGGFTVGQNPGQQGISAGTLQLNKGPTNSTMKTFHSYCVQILEQASGSKLAYGIEAGVSYFATVNPQVPTFNIASTVVDRLARLFTVVSAHTVPTAGQYATGPSNSLQNYTATEVGAAIQMAVWESVYETGSTLGVNLNNGSWAVRNNLGSNSTQARVVKLANHLLGQASALTTYISKSSVHVLAHHDSSPTQNNGRQDYILIPEPATIALALAALAGLGFARRGKQN